MAYATEDEVREMKKILGGRNAVEDLKNLDKDYLKNFRTKSGFNILHLARDFYERDNVIQYLVKIGCNLYQKTTTEGSTPLNYYLGHTYTSGSIIKCFINAGANLSWTHVSTKFGSLKIKESLVAAMFYDFLLEKSPYHITNNNKKSDITRALCKFLLDLGWPVDGIASLRNDELTMYALKKHGIKKIYDQLIAAIKLGDALQVRSMLEKNILTQHKIITSKALIEASKSPSPTSEIIIKLLLDKGACVNGFFEDYYEDDIPVCEAYKLNNLHNTWFLFDNSANITNIRSTDQIIEYVNFHELNSMQKRDFFLNKTKCLSILLQHEGLCIAKLLEENIFKEFLSRFLVYGYFLDNDNDTNVPYRSYYTQPVIKWLAKLHNLNQDDCYKSILKNEFLSEYFAEMYDEENELDPHYEEKFIKYFDDYFDSCNKEITKMKSFMISENITVWYILSKSIEKIIPYSRNDKLIRKSKVLSLEKNFPLYSDTLVFKMSKAHERAIQIEKSIRVLSKYLPLLGYNYLILEMIVKYLGVPNLLVLD